MLSVDKKLKKHIKNARKPSLHWLSTTIYGKNDYYLFLIEYTTMTSYKIWLNALFALMLMGVCLFTTTAKAVPPVTTSGNQVLYGGKIASLAGNSFFWSNDNYGGERYYNQATVAWLKNDWKSPIVRAAMGVEDPGGFIDSPSNNRNRVKALVNAAIANNIYVIIDWHSHYAERNPSQAVSFFREMAQLYGKNNNVIFEVYNEPISASWEDIKRYALPVIKAIRETGSNNLIIVGTPFYSQRVDVASNSPITGYDNIAYTLHFYAGTHNTDLRNKAATALANGIPLFVTEWGTVNANGDGGVAAAETRRWMSFLAKNNISHLNWSVNDKQEGASVIKPGTSTNGNWPDANLTASGIVVRDIIRGWQRADLSDVEDPIDIIDDKPITVAPVISLLLEE